MDLTHSAPYSVLTGGDLRDFYSEQVIEGMSIVGEGEAFDCLDTDFLNFVYNLISNEFKSTWEHPFGESLPPNSAELVSCLEELKRRLQEPSDVVTPDDVEKKGVDHQGLVWDEMQREQLLDLRRRRYRSFVNTPFCKERALSDINVDLRDVMDIWEFKSFWKKPRPRITHFQLRNELMCVDDRSMSVYYVAIETSRDFYGQTVTYPIVKKLNLISGEIITVLELKEDPFNRISTIEVSSGILIVGTLTGTYFIHDLKTGKTSQRTLTISGNGIVNFTKTIPNTNITIFSSNDRIIFEMDLHSSKTFQESHMPWAVNHISLHPLDPSLRLMAGDNINTFIFDTRINPSTPISILRGHRDFCFTSDWSHDGLTIATGSQDGTVRMWDVRSLKEEMCCMSGEGNSSVCTVQFNHDDSALVFSESVDYVNVVDLSCNLENGVGNKQCLSMFGKVAGAEFVKMDDEGGEGLVIGVSDEAIGGVLMYERESLTKCLDYDAL